MKKFYCIELLRFFTSLAVVIRHYHFFFYPRSSLSTIHILKDTSIQPFYPLLQILYEKGEKPKVWVFDWHIIKRC